MTERREVSCPQGLLGVIIAGQHMAQKAKESTQERAQERGHRRAHLKMPKKLQLSKVFQATKYAVT